MLDTACGYHVRAGFLGRAGERWILFATEEEFFEYLKDYTNCEQAPPVT